MDDKKSLYWITILAGIVLIVFIYFIGYRSGYTCARTDLNELAARKTATRAMLNQSKLAPSNATWIEWAEVGNQRDELIDEINELVNSWDGKNIDTLDKLIRHYITIQKLLETSQGPPGAEWYCSALLNESINRQKAYQLIKQGLQTGSNEIYIQGLKLEEKTINDFVDASERYEQWLIEEGY